MQPDYSRFWPYAIAGLAVFLIYRRFRRSFGRQPLRPVRMWIRIVLLVLLSCSLLPSALKSGQFLFAELAGAVAGMALGFWGARHTRYATYEGRLHYVPHTYTGVAVSLLFIGRLVYRVAEWYGQNGMLQGAADVAPPPMMRSPLTVGLIFVVVGYYVCYYAMVLWKSKRISPEDLEATRPRPPPRNEAAELLPADEG
jgi:NhaP-type Na+/H+ or K+/H+ antiporter